MVHFVFWTSRWDEWISRASPRLAPAQSRICKQASNQASELAVTYLCATLLCCVCLSHQMCLEGLFALGSEWTFSTAIPTFKSGQRATLCASCQAKLSSTFMYNTAQTRPSTATSHCCSQHLLACMCVCALFLQGYGSKFDETHDVPFNPDLIQPYGAHTKKKRGYRYCLFPTLSHPL